MGEEVEPPTTHGAPPSVQQLRVFHRMMRQLHESETKTTTKVPHHDDDSTTSCSIQDTPNLSTFQLSFEEGNLATEQHHQPSGPIEHHKVVSTATDAKCNGEQQWRAERHYSTTSSMLNDDSPRCTTQEDEVVAEKSFFTSSWAILAWKHRSTQSRVWVATAGLLVVGVSLGYLLSGPPHSGRRRRR